MTFFAVVMRGLWRRPVRTGLTLMGIAIGIGAVVALVGMSRGFESSWTAGLKTRGTDIVVNNMKTSLTPTPFPESARDRIAHVPGIAATCELLVELISVESAEMTIVSAREWGTFSWSNLKVVSGRLPRDEKERAVVLGVNAAEALKKKVGDPIQIETGDLTVVGIVEGGAIVEDGAVILALPLFQELTGNEGKINVIDVRVTPGMAEPEMRTVADQISSLIPEAHAGIASEHMRNSQSYRIINAMSWSTSLLAVLVGVFGVMNTMLMTVFERRQEIAILLAIGWRRTRIIRMILLESAMLGFLGGLLGMVLGVIGIKLLETAPAIRGLLKPELSVHIMGISLVIAVVAGVASGLYPAWRSSRLSPSLAIQG